MKNGNIPTSTMIQMLMKHCKDDIPWTASAPEVQHSAEVPGGWVAMTATSHGNSCVSIMDSAEKTSFSTIPYREDWTIHRKGEKPVPEAPQFIGGFTRDPGGWSGLDDVMTLIEDLPEGEHRIYVKSKTIRWSER